MLRDFEKGDLVQYNNPQVRAIGLVLNAKYCVKPDDFLIFIMWPDTGTTQALLQNDCHTRGLRILD